MLLQVKLDSVILFGLFCISLILTLYKLLSSPPTSSPYVSVGKRPILCYGPCARNVGSFLSIHLLRQAYSHSVFERQWDFCVNNKKEGLRKRALVMEMQKQNIQAIEGWENTCKLWKILSDVSWGQTLDDGPHLEMQTSAFWVDVQFSVEWHWQDLSHWATVF